MVAYIWRNPERNEIPSPFYQPTYKYSIFVGGFILLIFLALPFYFKGGKKNEEIIKKLKEIMKITSSSLPENIELVKKIKKLTNSYIKENEWEFRAPFGRKRFGGFARVQIFPLSFDIPGKKYKRSIKKNIISSLEKKNYSYMVPSKKFYHISSDMNSIFALIVLYMEGLPQIKNGKIIEKIKKYMNGGNPFFEFEDFLENCNSYFLQDIIKGGSKKNPFSKLFRNTHEKILHNEETPFLISSLIIGANKCFSQETLNFYENTPITLFSFFSISFNLLIINNYIKINSKTGEVRENEERKMEVDKILFLLFQIISTISNYGGTENINLFLESEIYRNISAIVVPGKDIVMERYLKGKINKFINDNNINL